MTETLERQTLDAFLTIYPRGDARDNQWPDHARESLSKHRHGTAWAMTCRSMTATCGIIRMWGFTPRRYCPQMGG